jgi:hypothetical protein
MKKPIKPEKYQWITRSATFLFDFGPECQGRKAPWPDFRKWVEGTLTCDTKEPIIEIDYEYSDYAEDGIVACHLQLSWQEKAKIPGYNAKMKAYSKRLAKWEKER